MERDTLSPPRQESIVSVSQGDRRRHPDQLGFHNRGHNDWQPAGHRVLGTHQFTPSPQRSSNSDFHRDEFHSEYSNNRFYHHREESTPNSSQYRHQQFNQEREDSLAAPSQVASNDRFFCRDSVDASSQISYNREFRDQSVSSFEPHPTQTQSSTRSSQWTSPSPMTQSRKASALPSVSTKSAIGRGSNFNKSELEQLCRSWLNISEDALVSTDQKSSTFWQKITDDFNARMEADEDDQKRSMKSIQSRWGTLNKAMACFAACVQQVKMIRETGKTIEDQFQDALMLYNKDVGSPFVNVSCYNIVKYSAKWTDNPQYVEMCGQKRKASNSDHLNDVEVDGIPAGTPIGDINLPQLDRPAGTKQTKRSRNSKTDDQEGNQAQILANTTCTANATERIAHHLDRASSSLKAMLELSLLQTDTSRLNENVRAALEADKESLLLRRAARRPPPPS